MTAKSIPFLFFRKIHKKISVEIPMQIRIFFTQSPQYFTAKNHSLRIFKRSAFVAAAETEERLSATVVNKLTRYR